MKIPTTDANCILKAILAQAICLASCSLLLKKKTSVENTAAIKANTTKKCPRLPGHNVSFKNVIFSTYSGASSYLLGHLLLMSSAKK